MSRSAAPVTKSHPPTSPNTAPATQMNYELWLYSIVTVLNCYFTELSLYWTVTLLNWDCTELSLYWTVTFLNCDCTELLLYWTLTLLNCYFTELLLYWTVTLLNCYFTELLLDWSVTLLNCYLTDLLLYWTVTLLSCYITELLLYWIFSIFKSSYSEVSHPNFLWLYISRLAALLRIPFFGSAPKKCFILSSNSSQKFSLPSDQLIFRDPSHTSILPDSSRSWNTLHVHHPLRKPAHQGQLTGWRSFFWEGVPYNMTKWLSNLTRRRCMCGWFPFNFQYFKIYFDLFDLCFSPRKTLVDGKMPWRYGCSKTSPRTLHRWRT